MISSWGYDGTPLLWASELQQSARFAQGAFVLNEVVSSGNAVRG